MNNENCFKHLGKIIGVIILVITILIVTTVNSNSKSRGKYLAEYMWDNKVNTIVVDKFYINKHIIRIKPINSNDYIYLVNCPVKIYYIRKN